MAPLRILDFTLDTMAVFIIIVFWLGLGVAAVGLVATGMETILKALP
jgi:hypothetical protein